MPFMPFHILGIWFRGLLAIAILAGGIYLLKRWYDDSHVVEQQPSATAAAERSDDGQPLPERRAATPERRTFRFDPGWNRQTAEFTSGLALLAWATLGRLIGSGVWMLTLRQGKPTSSDPLTPSEPERRESKRVRRQKRQTKVVATQPEEDEDPSEHRTGDVHMIRKADGTELRIECYGPTDAPPIVFTHGWGANSTEWYYQKRFLADRFRLIVWDEPGLGLSRKPVDNNYRLEKMATDLDEVLSFAGQPAILVGHSIGGMITLTYCKQFPQALGKKVVGLALAHTTYTNPVRTTSMAGLYTAIEKPVLVPFLYLTIATWPLVWLMNWMSYFNGSAHRSTHKSSFSGNETRGQLDFVSRFMPHARPDVLARGMLGMIAYDATAVLPTINVPTLVFVGDKDTTTLPEAGEFIVQNVPKASLVNLSPAKHMGLLEHHDQFDRRLADFVLQCQPNEATN